MNTKISLIECIKKMILDSVAQKVFNWCRKTITLSFLIKSKGIMKVSWFSHLINFRLED
jgi:hypothetical protein